MAIRAKGKGWLIIKLRIAHVGGTNTHCSLSGSMLHVRPTEAATSLHKSVEFHGLFTAAGIVLNFSDTILNLFEKLQFSISVTVFGRSYNLRSYNLRSSI